MAESSYNGWVNYETWAVKLWLDNEESCYLEVTDRASDTVAEANGLPITGDDVTYDFAEWLRGYVIEYLIPDLPASLGADLLNAALSEVRWSELAESYLHDADSELALS